MCVCVRVRVFVSEDTCTRKPDLFRTSCTEAYMNVYLFVYKYAFVHRYERVDAFLIS